MGYSFVYNSGNYEEEKPSEKLHLEFGLFFDGTLNNKEHTALRLKVLNIDDLIIYPSDSEKTVRWKEQELAKRRERIHQGGLSKEDKDAFEIKIKKDYYEKKRVVPTQEEVRQILQDIINKDVKDYERADKRDWLDKQGVDNSFMNDYTNVARLYMSCDEAYAIYIEGIGTLNRQKDVDAGFQYGSGTSGIRAKVRKGCEELAQKIIEERNKKEKKGIAFLSVTVDVFGFSRGATAARNFLYEVNSTHKREKDIVIKKQTKKVLDKDLINPYSPNDDSVYTTKEVFTGFYIDKDNVIVNMDYIENDHMPKYGYLGYYLLENGFSKEELQNMTLSIRFLGIYDTVSSYEDVGDLNALSKIDHGIKHTRKNYFKDDVEQLQINNLGYFKQAVHFVAMDEHRQNFALTHLKGTNCKEKVLPGVHSDIGGGYETGIEVVDELEISPAYIFFQYFLYARKQQFISKYWYTDEQLKIELERFPFPSESEERNRYIAYFKKIRDYYTNVRIDFKRLFQYNKLRGIRFLKKEYSYIPLHLMEKAFRKVLWGRSAEKIIRIPTGKGYPFPKEKTIQEKFGINKEGVLETAQKILDAYVFGDKNKWEFLSDDKLGAILKKEKEKLSLRKPISIKEKEQGKQTKINSQQTRDKIPSPKPLPLDKEEIQLIQEVKKKNPIFEEQQILRILRNQYLHWSANKDWFGMQPAPGRKRDTY